MYKASAYKIFILSNIWALFLRGNIICVQLVKIKIVDPSGGFYSTDRNFLFIDLENLNFEAFRFDPPKNKNIVRGPTGYLNLGSAQKIESATT